MNSNFLFIIAVCIVLIILYIPAHKIRQTRKQLPVFRKKYAGQHVLLCDSAEDLGDNLIQFYGEVAGESIKPGMVLVDVKGSRFVIKEVYGDEKNPSKPSDEAPVGMSTAIVIETEKWDWNSFNEALKRDRIVGLRIASI